MPTVNNATKSNFVTMRSSAN